jgi:carbonic anhydrase
MKLRVSPSSLLLRPSSANPLLTSLPPDDPTHIAVIALLLQLTPHHHLTTPLLDTVISHIQAIPTAGTTTHIPSLDFESLTSVINHSQFYHYSGSLTTPPCSEGVTFMIATKPLPLYVSTYNELKAVVKSNSRFVQAGLGGENLLGVAAQHL